MSTSFKNTMVNAPDTSLLPIKEVAYTLGLGKVDVPANTKADVSVIVEVDGGPSTEKPVAGLVLYCSLSSR